MNTFLLAISLFQTPASAQAAKEPARLSLQLGHSEAVYALGLSEDGRFLMTFGEDQYAVLWDAESGAELRRYGNLPCSPNAGLLLKAKDLFVEAGRNCGGRLVVYQLSTGKKLAAVAAHKGPINRIARSPDGKLLATAGEDGKVVLWAVGTWAPLRTFARGDNIGAVAFSPDGALLAAAGGSPYQRKGADYSTHVWDVRTGEELARLESRVKVTDVLFLPGRRLATIAPMSDYEGPNRHMVPDGGVSIWDLETRELLSKTETNHSRAAALPNGRFLTTSAEAIVADKRGESAYLTSGRHPVAEWDPAVPSTSTYSLSDPSIVDSVSINFDAAGKRGKIFGNWDHAARRWTLGPDGGVKVVYVGTIQPIGGVAVSPLGDRIVTTHLDGTVRFWSFDAAELVRSSVSAHLGGAASVSFDATGRRLVTTGYDERVLDWNLDTVTIRAAHWGMGGGRVAIDSVGARIYAGGVDGVLELDAATKAVLRTWQLGAYDFLFAEESGLLVLGLGSGGIQIIDLRSAAVRETLNTEPGGGRSLSIPRTGSSQSPKKSPLLCGNLLPARSYGRSRRARSTT